MQGQQTAINNHLHILSDEVLPRVLTNIEQLSQYHVISYAETAYDHLMAHPANAEKLNKAIAEVKTGESVQISFETFDALV